MTLWYAPWGAARLFGATARGLALDGVAGLLRGAQTVASTLQGTEKGLATLRVRALILRDESGQPLLQPADLGPALRCADRIFRQHANIRIRITDVAIAAEKSATPTLDPRANRGLILDEILGHTRDYRRGFAARPWTSLGGEPITVVIVRNISGTTTGVSLGMSADWVICQASLFDPHNARRYDETVLAHELGHALNLPHSKNRHNLMFPSSSPPKKLRGTALNRWQKLVLHANRHIVPPAR